MNFYEYLWWEEQKTWSAEERASNERERLEERNAKSLSKNITNYVLREIKNQRGKIGVLLCEGDEKSIDKAVYSAVFPDYIVVPVGSCATIMRVLPRLKRNLKTQKIYAFGIIDRDGLSKQEIKDLYDELGIYTTKLPFIENIICTPEVLEYLCEDRGLDYEEIKRLVQDKLLKSLWRQLKEALPINIDIQKQEFINSITIQATTKEKSARKLVDRNNIMYAYRDKIITIIVGNAIGIRLRKEYYEEIKLMLSQEKYREALIKVMAKYIPKLELYEFKTVK